MSRGGAMRLGNMYGPDATFAGVPAASLDDPVHLRRRPGPSSWVRPSTVAPVTGRAAASAPRPSASPTTCPTTGAGRAWPSGSTRWSSWAWSTSATSRCPRATPTLSCARLEAAVETIAEQRCHPRRARGRPHHRLSRRHRVRPPRGLGPGVDDPLRRPRRHGQRAVRGVGRPRDADAPAHRVGSGAGRPLPPDRAPRLLARSRDAGLDGRSGHAQLRDDRSGRPVASTTA